MGQPLKYGVCDFWKKEGVEKKMKRENPSKWMSMCSTADIPKLGTIISANFEKEEKDEKI
jgi:hypothetical protein